MASIKYNYRRKQWQIRWHITDPVSKTVFKGSKLLPKGCLQIEAENYAAQFEKKSRLIKSGSSSIADSLPIAIDKWLTSIKEYTGRTQDLYKKVIQSFTESLPDHISNIEHIRPLHIAGYINSMLARNLKNRTCNAHLTAIKSFSHWFADIYGIANPSIAIRMLKESPSNARFITEDEYIKIIANGTELFRQRIKFIANTGLRATEFCNLQWTDLSPDQQSITIEGKGRKIRTIPLNDTCRQILREIPKIHTHIFISKSQANIIHKLNRNVLYNQCLDAAEKTHVPVFGPHSLRHYFATQLLIKGVPLALVSKILGHSDIRTTMKIYAHIAPKHLHGLTDCLDK